MASGYENSPDYGGPIAVVEYCDGSHDGNRAALAAMAVRLT